MSTNLPTAEELRALTVEAIAEGTSRARAKAQRSREAAVRKEKTHQLFAEHVLSKVPGKCRKAAVKQQADNAVVMQLKYRRDYKESRNTDRLDPALLQGPGKIVYNHLVAAGLNVTIDYWHSGDGMNSGYNLVVRWSNS